MQYIHLDEEIEQLRRSRAPRKQSLDLIKRLKEVYSIGSAKVKLSEVRKALGEKNRAFKYLRLSENDYSKLRSDYQQNVSTRQGELKPLSASKMIDTAAGMIKSNDPFVVIAGLALITGRRPVELGLLGEMRKIRRVGDRSRFPRVRFSGQAKTRGAELAQNGAYEVPVLLPPSKVIVAFDRMRATLPQGTELMTPKAFTARWVKKINVKVDEAFGSEWSCSLLRAAYATFCATRFKKRTESELVYFAAILGHRLLGDGAADLQTAQSYVRFYNEHTVE